MPDPSPEEEMYAIARLKKIKRKGLGLTHAARAENGVRPEHAIPGAPEPEVLFNVASEGMDFQEFVLRRYDEAIKDGVVYRPRRDQVLAIEGLLTASPAFFRPKEPGKAGAYTRESVEALRENGLKFLHDRYGERLIRAELQLDEVTPHIQYAFLPIDRRGRWSAKNCTTRGLMKDLWTKWAKAMEKFGLRRGIPGSKARHEPIKTYYAAINSFEAASIEAVKRLSIQPPKLPTPSRLSLINPKDYIAELNETLAAWCRKETKRVLKLIEPLIAAATDANLSRRRSKQMRRTAEQQVGKISVLESKVSSLAQQSARFEPVSAEAVAERIGYEKALDLKPYPNGLAFLIQFEGLDKNQSLGWLAAEFGSEAAAATAADLVRADTLAEANGLARPQLRTVSELTKILKTQLLALGADSYRLASRKHGDKSSSFADLLVPGTKVKDWTVDDIVETVVGLKKRTVSHEVRLVPVSQRYGYLRISGLKSPKVLSDAGLKACSIVCLEPGQHEVILRVPNEMGQEQLAKAYRALKAIPQISLHDVDNKAPVYLAGLRSAGSSSLVAVELIAAEDVDLEVSEWPEPLKPARS